MEMAVIAYAILCVAVALFGRKSRIGFWGVLLFSALATPVIVFYGILGLRPAKKHEAKEAGAVQKRRSFWPSLKV